MVDRVHRIGKMLRRLGRDTLEPRAEGPYVADLDRVSADWQAAGSRGRGRVVRDTTPPSQFLAPKLAIWDRGRYNRPAGPGPEAATEPLWLPNAFAVYRHALHVRPAGAETWQTLAWVLGKPGADRIAAALGIGATDGPYPWGFLSGPRESGIVPDGVRLDSGRYPARGQGEPVTCE